MHDHYAQPFEKAEIGARPDVEGNHAGQGAVDQARHAQVGQRWIRELNNNLQRSSERQPSRRPHSVVGWPGGISPPGPVKTAERIHPGIIAAGHDEHVPVTPLIDIYAT